MILHAKIATKLPEGYFFTFHSTLCFQHFKLLPFLFVQCFVAIFKYFIRIIIALASKKNRYVQSNIDENIYAFQFIVFYFILYRQCPFCHSIHITNEMLFSTVQFIFFSGNIFKLMMNSRQASIKAA